MHREDVKAGLRKRFGTIAAFERARSLPPKSVNDVLRGSTNARVTEAIEKALTEPLAPTNRPDFSGCSADAELSHRIIVGGR
ncbi:hypothetical protein PQ455_10545 [Sphingomonas naphthae]|uniref:Ner winged helix-turn-helix DNA-binding domain-containing protein n=2 Tax=Sphingomonas naphthae TaxID=1813468 RepID=A0ABY7TQY9_9SPHN|nr:hypothetical protein [Sphingomonas naphthae]WCT75443.1 hypothetical protein PQ455_10545 [Sphingomonas naphthae]